MPDAALRRTGEREHEEREMGLAIALWIIAAPAVAFVFLSRR